jgi:hypothetical protein
VSDAPIKPDRSGVQQNQGNKVDSRAHMTSKGEYLEGVDGPPFLLVRALPLVRWILPLQGFVPVTW